MRALLLLCLLHAARGQYGWNGPMDQTIVLEPETDNACDMDQGSCGCCLMYQQVNRMRMYFNMTLNRLETQYLQTKQSLNNLKASRVALSVALYSEARFKCFGPFGFNNTIMYKHVFLNLGGSYDTSTGIFTVPRSGVYSLAITIYSDAGAPGNTLAASAALQVNGVMMAMVREKNSSDQEDSATIVVALHLKAGDRVAVILPAGCFLCDDNNHYNTFSAFLLYATD